MSRIRSVHPGLFTDEAFMSTSPAARLLVIGIWTECWDDGVFEWKPLTLKAKIFPVDNVALPELLKELEDNGFLKRFSNGGKDYGAVRNFRRFQRPKYPNSSGVLPAELRSYVGLSDDLPEALPEHSGNDGEKPPQMEDGVGEGREKIKSKNKSSSDSRAPKSFPADGPINYVAPFGEIAKRKGRGADVNVLAQAFRSFCFDEKIDLADPAIAQKFETFCGKHRVRGLHS
ncbi:hypothetical protein [Terrarubrum flagellatum]|uniref:hypothetical protein n=1 Tax=Terrirubrum flagellatum TaxID=2895980 RepID=UPI0031451828